MKYLAYIMAMFVFTTTWAQETPKEVKQETQVKTVKYDDGEATTEKKVKVVTRETADVKLDKKDKEKVNQQRVKSTKKVEKMLMVDDDNDAEFDLLTKTTHFVNDNGQYKFTPTNRGFDIAFDNDNNQFVEIGSAWTTQSGGNYIISGEVQNGIGYFNKNGDFVIEYYDETSNQIKTKIYTKGSL
ncbi:hypothetical protein [Tamlana crocina]|uniref:Uncharacterized protein n=1 Tax=Tamlana crocina TaxID=393006 RepID=A0ABX1DD24_9FLAO|nr:hypothetical protein [Tamlana crocina]NJX15111.1 hypothetical protein [Tamlana crocina]